MHKPEMTMTNDNEMTNAKWQLTHSNEQQTLLNERARKSRGGKHTGNAYENDEVAEMQMIYGSM